MIKAAAGFHHLSRHNRHGARSKLADSLRTLRLFPTNTLGVRTDLLLLDVSTWVERLDKAGPVPWKHLDALPTPCIHQGLSINTK